MNTRARARAREERAVLRLKVGAETASESPQVASTRRLSRRFGLRVSLPGRRTRVPNRNSDAL